MVQQAHPLIPREQTYVLDRKLVSIHSFDRDIKKWPFGNHFEIELPQAMRNIQSMRLLTITLPSNKYVFSSEYQNTKLSFEFIPIFGLVKTYQITISEGSYTPVQLVTEIQTKMNKVVAADGDPTYNSFRCKYNEITNNMWFGNLKDKFTLLFDTKIIYEKSCSQVDVWDHYTEWGLPAYLGYKKRKYVSEATPPNPWWSNTSGDPFGFDYEVVDGSGTEWLNNSSTDNFFINIYDLSANPQDPSGICNMNVAGSNSIYMEIEKYNSMDEIEPYSENTGGWFNNDYAGKVKSAFAKIPIVQPYSTILEGSKSFIANISHYNPPIDRINRLRFTFRYHDGRLVDFKCLPFTFTLEFNMLRDEQAKAMSVRIPSLYNT